MNGRRRIGEGVDLVNYTWVDQYLKGLEYQAEIKALKDENESIQRSPKTKGEVLEELKGLGDQVKALRVEKVRAVLSRYQNGEITGLTPHVFAQVAVHAQIVIMGLGHTAAHDFESLLADDIIKAALKEMPEGISRAEKKAKGRDYEAKIAALQAKIEKECWPDSRKVFNDKGEHIVHEDRWQEVVDHWYKVAAPYNKPVDFFGYAIEQHDPAWEAFRKLKIPLRGSTTPRKR
jgi:hypothetical protein